MNKKSLFAYIVIAIVYIYSNYHYKVYKNAVEQGDALGYFAYLPAFFVHDDVHTFDKTHQAKRAQEGKSAPTADEKLFYNDKKLPNGYVLDKYTCGVAIMASPFYLVAHWIAKLSGLKANGFSEIYVVAFLFAGFFYIMAGLWLIRSFLLRYFEDINVAITLIVIAFATNLYYYGGYTSAMSHSYLFFLYAQLIYATIKFHEKPIYKQAIWIGLCAGAITVIRPTEIICLIIPFLYDIATWNDFKEKIKFLIENKSKIIVAIIFFILAGVPQMLYWKAVTGHFLYYSYEKESFDFKHPHIVDGLFSFGNGWLAYCPIMALSIVGIYFLRNTTRWKSVILLLLPIHIYIIYSWWCWNYINGVGSRPMVEMYPILSISLAAFWERIQKVKVLQGFFILLTILAAYWYMSIIWQVNNGLNWTDSSNKYFQFYMFGKTKADWRAVTMFDNVRWQPDTLDVRLDKVLIASNFEDSTAMTQIGKTPFGKSCIKLSREKEFFGIFVDKVENTGLQKNDWIKVEVQFMREYVGTDFWKNSTIVVDIDTPQKKGFIHSSLRLDNKSSREGPTIWGWENNIWTKAYFFVKARKAIPPNSEIKIFIWNPTENPIFIDNAKVEIYKDR
jgi:hypothetical protein